MCPPFVSLLVSALFRWPCSISIHLSPRSVAAGVRPFPLAHPELHFVGVSVSYKWLKALCVITILVKFLLLPVVRHLLLVASCYY